MSTFIFIYLQIFSVMTEDDPIVKAVGYRVRSRSRGPCDQEYDRIVILPDHRGPSVMTEYLDHKKRAPQKE